MSTETKPVVMRITAVYEYELIPDLTKRQAAYGTTDPAECAQVDAKNPPDEIIGLADLKSFTIEAVGSEESADPLTIQCPHCHAKPGEFCQDFMGGRALKIHAKRIRRAGTFEGAAASR